MIYLLWVSASLAYSVINVKALAGAFNFEPGEGPRRGLFRDCKNIAEGSLRAPVTTSDH